MGGSVNGVEGLTRRESEVMRTVFSLSQGKERFLVTDYDLISALPAKKKYDVEKLETALTSLSMDGYFDLIFTDRKGERTYVIHMREPGLCFLRSDLRRRRSLRMRILITVLCGALSALVGILLRHLIH